MKTKLLISFAVTMKLICVFVFAYAKSQISHDTAQIIILVPLCKIKEAVSKICLLIHVITNTLLFFFFGGGGGSGI